MDKKPEDILNVDWKPPKTDWMDPKIDFEERRGSWSYPGAAKNLEYLGFANPREWSPAEEDWKLPDNWQEIIHEGLKERLAKYRSLKVFLDSCVRCGACADKCHFWLGSGDPKNMPVLRAELLRSVYRKDFTTAGKLLGGFAGARKMDHRRAEGVVLLLLPVHRVPALLGLLPLRHRHGRDHHDGPRADEPRGTQHQLDHRAGRQLPPHRQPPRHPAAHLQGQHRVPDARSSRRSPGSRSIRRSTRRAPRSWSSSPPLTTSPTRGPTPSWAT